MDKICVIGSLNVDLTVRLPRFHNPGETITAMDFSTFAGGKGGNQAVASARLSPGVLMVGKLGNDENAAFYRSVLRDNHVDASCVMTTSGVSSGVALIEVDEKGENRIAVVPGSNALVDRRMIDEVITKLMDYETFLLQLEIPLDTVTYVAELLHKAGKRVILDPAPARILPFGLLSNVDLVTPNETELSTLSGLPVDNDDEVRIAAKRLLNEGAKAVVAKLGARGAMYISPIEEYMISGYKVDVVDTTAAGDSFNAGLAVALSEGMPVAEALRFANATGALSVTGAGAQQAMPTRAEVEAFLSLHQ